MGISSDLIMELVKVTSSNEKPKDEATVYGTMVKYNNTMYVQLDGSELLTPVSITADAKDGERVTVLIKNHNAIVTGNMSSPAARSEDVQNAVVDAKDIVDQIAEFEIIVADKVSTAMLDAERGRIDTLISDTAIIRTELNARKAEINELITEDVTINNTLTAQTASIEELKTKKLDAELAVATYATIKELEATNADIHNLEATYGEFQVLATNKFTSIESKIQNLEVGNFDAVYANIDFSNIGTAAIQYFFSSSGMIENLVVGEGTVTGKLVGVTIKGDQIEGNTIVADKLVIKGTDGLYYKLNTDGMKTEAEQTDQNSLNGSVIMAKSITATKIDVKDLVAFDATIGGFNITEKALYSGTKESVDNTTDGVYMDSDGQLAIGGVTNYIKYYVDAEGNRKLVISADNILLGSSDIAAKIEEISDDVSDALDGVDRNTEGVAEAQTAADSAEARLVVAESMIKQISDTISMLVTDRNGASLMTQTEDGWTFSTGSMQDIVDELSESLNDLTKDVGDANEAVGILKQAVADLGTLSEYIKIGTYESEPCIELGESDSDFKLLITNTRIMFREGASIPAYINNRSLYIEKAIIKDELHQGGFVWKVRSNGNLGLMWKG